MVVAREAVLAALGEFPRRVEPRFEVVGSEERDGYTLQTVEYDVEAGERVRSFLLVPLVPRGLGAATPAILAPHQHAMQYHIGKSEVIGAAGDPMYAYGAELCRRGYVVLAPDHLGFEGRASQAFGQGHDASVRFEQFEYLRRLVNGSSLLAKYVHDLTVAVDVLVGLPYVDAKRIGVIGHSLGGQTATWLTWYDERIAVGVSSCGISNIGTMFRDNIVICLSTYVPGIVKLGDMGEIVCGIAPRPFFMSSGSEDLNPVDGVEAIVNMVSAEYGRLGASENFVARIFDGGHMFGDAEKVEAYALLDRVLGGELI